MTTRYTHRIALTAAAAAFAWTGLATAQTSEQFEVRITIEDSCELTTPPTDMDFGTVQLLNQDHDADSSVAVTCTTGLAYSLNLDAGQNDDTTTRRMTDGTDFVSYRLYNDSGRTTLWGDGTTFGNGVSDTGTGVEQTVTVYGRVSDADNATTPPAGAYSDTVTVTVGF